MRDSKRKYYFIKQKLTVETQLYVYIYILGPLKTLFSHDFNHFWNGFKKKSSRHI